MSKPTPEQTAALWRLVPKAEKTRRVPKTKKPKVTVIEPPSWMAAWTPLAIPSQPPARAGSLDFQSVPSVIGGR